MGTSRKVLRVSKKLKLKSDLVYGGKSYNGFNKSIMQNSLFKYERVVNSIGKNLFSCPISSLMGNDKLSRFSTDASITEKLLLKVKNSNIEGI